MKCEIIKKIIPGYIKHTASEEQIKIIEEHLSVCEDCRRALSLFMDKAENDAQKETLPENEEKSAQEESTIENKDTDLQEETTLQDKKIESWEYAIVGIAGVILFLFIFLLLKG